MQNFKNHLRFYPAHHFIFYPVIGFLFVFAIRKAFVDDASSVLWFFAAGIVFMIGWLSFMVRQHYGMTIQNRVVVLEMRFRYFVLTNKRFEPLEEKLSFGQIAALRFASDEELPALVQRTLTENLSTTAIKKSVTNWMPDHKRI
ncbi:MAG: hypothetical protein EOO89_06820 [Pedobacter sp.]|nr:MAG: hypothetical protein EOO89_06820 [Pedobacter sp.]